MISIEFRFQQSGGKKTGAQDSNLLVVRCLAPDIPQPSQRMNTLLQLVVQEIFFVKIGGGADLMTSRMRDTTVMP
jgi:hypothetical protein